MNGYLSSTASLKIQGLKKTLAAKSPTYAVFDIDILANSPKRLTKSGIFDVTCSYLIENDWLLSHYLKMDDNLYDKFYFDVQRPFLENLQNNLTENFDHINNDDLLSLLIITGILMNFCQNSNPASQAEHLIAHLLEMQKSFKKELYHGEQVLIGCLLSYNLQKYIMQNFNNIILTLKTDIKFTKIFPKNYSQICQKLYKIKLDKIEVNKNFNSFTSPFKDNSMIFNENLKKTAKIFQFLSIENISLNPLYYLKSQKDLEFALRNAALIRDRFTHLDLLVNSNINLNDLTTEANH